MILARNAISKRSRWPALRRAYCGHVLALLVFELSFDYAAIKSDSMHQNPEFFSFPPIHINPSSLINGDSDNRRNARVNGLAVSYGFVLAGERLLLHDLAYGLKRG